MEVGREQADVGEPEQHPGRGEPGTGRLDLDAFVSERIGLGDVEAAFAALAAGVPGEDVVYSGTNLTGADLDYLLARVNADVLLVT